MIEVFMQAIDALPDKKITDTGVISKTFLIQGVTNFQDACRHVHQMPYGYNVDRDDLFALFQEGKGTCTSKHAVIGILAQELGLPVEKHIGIYEMTEFLVTGTKTIIDRYQLPYLPMVHCFLQSDSIRVDLTLGNRNGKNGPIKEFLYTEAVTPNIAEKEEYLLYRNALKERILLRPEFADIDMTTVLKARQEGLELLKANVATT